MLRRYLEPKSTAANAVDSPDSGASGTCVGSLTSASFDPAEAITITRATINSGFDDQFSNNVAGARNGTITVNVTVPDSAVAGDKYVVHVPSPASIMVYETSVKAPDGSVIASAEMKPVSSGRDLVFTYTDYVNTHRGVTFSYTTSNGYSISNPREGQTYTMRIIGCDKDSPSATRDINGRDQINMPGMAYSWGSNPDLATGAMRYTGHKTEADSQLVTVVLDVSGPNDGTRFPGTHIYRTDDPKNAPGVGVGVATWDGEFITSQVSGTYVEGNPTKAGEFSIGRDAKNQVLTIKMIVPKAGQGVFIQSRTFSNEATAWRDAGESPFTMVATETVADKKWTQQTAPPRPKAASGGGGGTSLKAATPATPTVKNADKCGVRSTITLPTTEGVTYTASSLPAGTKGGTVTVTAAAKDGYYIPADTTKTWTLTIPDATPCPVDATWAKTWDASSKTWTLTVTNPSTTADTKPVTLTDSVTITDNKGNTSQATGETITAPSAGTANGDTWSVPALKPGQTATATVKAKAEWLSGDRGEVANHLGKAGDDTCAAATTATASCAVSVVKVDADATWTKTWDADKQEWTLTVSNPAKDRPTRPITLVDSATILDAKGQATDIEGEVITNPSLGTVNGDTWTIPAIPAGGTATAVVKAKDEWLSGNGGSVINRLAKAGDKKCPAAKAASAHCAISTVMVDVNPVVSKSWDKDTHVWTITVSNPSKDVPARSVTIRDNLAAKNADGTFKDLEGEVLSNPTGGSVDGATWVTPALQPGETASVMVKAKDEWLTGDGQLVNRAGVDGAKCVTDPASSLDSCAEVIVAQTPAPQAEAAPAQALARTGVGLGLAALAGLLTMSGTIMLTARRRMV